MAIFHSDTCHFHDGTEALGPFGIKMPETGHSGSAIGLLDAPDQGRWDASRRPALPSGLLYIIDQSVPLLLVQCLPHYLVDH